MRYQAESNGRGETVAQSITLSPLQFESMMAGFRRQSEHDLKILNIQGVVPNGAQAYSKSTCPKKRVNNRGRSLIFSGTSKDPEDYLQWENNMEKWLQSSNLSKEEKLAHAVSAFTRTAREWWLKESTQSNYKKPVLDWRYLKARMYKVFVERYQSIPMSLATTTVSASLLIPELTPRASHSICACLKPMGGAQTIVCHQGDKEQSPITPTRTRSVECMLPAPGCINDELTNSLAKGEVVPADKEPGPEKEEPTDLSPPRHDQREETKTAANVLHEEETTTETIKKPRNEFVSSSSSSDHEELVLESGDLVGDQLRKDHVPQERGAKPKPRPEGPFQVLEQINHHAHPIDLHHELDLRTNPFKGGGNGAILERLYVINTQHNSEEKRPEEEREITAGLGALDKVNGAKMELSEARAYAWARRKKPSSVKPKLLRKHLRPKRKRLWVYGKAHGSIGSEEEDRAHEARPPDGQPLKHGPKPNQKSCKAWTIRVGQEVKQGEAQFEWARGEEEETWLQEPKPKKRPFHIWCWTCTRKRREAQREAH